MTLFSLPWDGQYSGDSGPYLAATWAQLYEMLFNNAFAAAEGVVPWGDLWNPTYGASTVSVSTGCAVVRGRVVWCTVAESVSLPRPTAATRYDLIVVRISWASQEPTVTRIAGAEGGGIPTPVQVFGTTWDLPLYAARVPVAGSIATATDYRRYARPLAAIHMRSGSSATDWQSANQVGGQNAYFPRYPYVQGGVASYNDIVAAVAEGDVRVDFPEPYDDEPFVLATAYATDPRHPENYIVVANPYDIDPDGCWIHFKNLEGTLAGYYVIGWLAYGEKRTA